MEENKIIRGSLPVVVLQLLQNNGRMYGYEITRAVREASKGKMEITEAALYPTLRKLEEEGYLTTETKMVEGRQRRYYKLNREGKKAATEQLAILEEAIVSLKKVFKYKLGNV
ncbi:MAG: PadR family transcriptional regulator [Edaphocola sp.]